MKKILIDMRTRPDLLQRLQAAGPVSVQLLEPEERRRELPPEILRDQHILFCTIPPKNLDAMKALELIQITTVGYTPLVKLGLPERGIRVCNARGVYDTNIAEWNITMMVNLARDMRGMIRCQEHGIWDQHNPRFQSEIRGSVVGLWGYGGIGRETARLAKIMGLGVHVLARRGIQPRTNIYQVAGTGDPDGKLPDRVFTAGQELDFLSGLDFLVLAMPQTAQSTGIMGEKEIRALPRSAFILNPARGPLIQEEALLTALRKGWITGAALDTHYHYPMPADHPLWRFPNVIMTPHISGSHFSPHFLDRAWDIFIQNAGRYLAGKPLLNELTAAELNDE